MCKWVKRVMVVFMLLLSSAIAVQWARSYFVFELLYWGPTKCSASTSEIRTIQVISSYGGIDIAHERISRTSFVNADGSPRFITGFVYDGAGGSPRAYPYVQPVRAKGEKELLHLQGAGFEILRTDQAGPPHVEITHVVVPFWFLLLLTGLFPAVVGVRYVRRRRREGRGFAVVVTETTCPADRVDGGARSE